MDTVVNSAIEEICCEGVNGLRLRDLWTKLGPCLKSCGLPLCPNVKRAIWENIVLVPGLKFLSGDGRDLCCSAENAVNFTVQEREEMNVKIIAPDSKRKSFLGIYETEASETTLSDIQRIILERLAVARTSGIAQNDLTKELGIPANNLSYPLKRLETQGLIVRKPTVIRKRKAFNSRDPNNCSIVSTNMLYLHRYGEHLGYQQRLEITREDKHLNNGEASDGYREAGDTFGKDLGKEDVHVKDFLPALKAICHKLEKAKGKVLVVSDLKRDLGYQGKAAHRCWRNLCHRLKDAQLVEECCTMINKKEVRCIRLVKSFSPLYFESKHQECGYFNGEAKQPLELLKKEQITEQTLEVSILRQIYSMIDAAGSKGLTNTEVCKRLGLCTKEYHKRYFQQMIARFGLYLQPEGQNRAEVYRVWTPGNYGPLSDMLTVGRGIQDANESSPPVMHSDSIMEYPQSAQSLDTLVCNAGSIRESEQDAEVTDEPFEERNINENSNITPLQCNQPNSVGVSDEETLRATTSLTTPPEAEVPVTLISSRKRSRRYPRLAVSAASTQREQHVIKILQEEKFLIIHELLRRLNDLDKVKNTTMDRKTLERTLNKLQQEGHCKCTAVSFPADTNCSSIRKPNVVLLPSCEISNELLIEIHKKFRSSSIQARKQNKGQSTTILDDVQRIPSSVGADSKSDYVGVLRANGFLVAKIARAKLLHIFLWNWIHSSPCLGVALLPCDIKNLHSTYKLFDLYLAIQSMPLELFLQIVGSTQPCNDMVGKSGDGPLLSCLPVEKYRSLMDTQATGRFSKLIDILQRLKLIRLVGTSNSEDGDCSPATTLTHALELKPYIEEPVLLVASSCSFHLDLRPQVRHDFVLSSNRAVQEYWNILEYCYAAAKPSAASLAFPGSAVREVFRAKPWLASPILTSEQRGELIKRITEYDLNKKLSLTECVKISEDLNVTIGQILRVYYDKRLHTRLQGHEESEDQEVLTTMCKRKLTPRRRKGCSNRLASKNHSILESSDAVLGVDEELAYEQRSSTSRDFNSNSQNNKEAKDLLQVDKEYDDAHRSKKHAVPSLNLVRQKKFFWTEESDRELVVEYAKQRAAHGPKFVKWTSFSNLPAPRAACERRICLLNRYLPFRVSLMKLCNFLGEQYTKYLEISGEKTVNRDDSRMKTSNPPEEEYCPVGVPEKWADFEDNTIKEALDDVLRHKRIAELEPMHPSIGSKIYNSAAIANAMELFKLIFLSNKKTSEVPVFLAQTLSRYAENDLYAAFDYLREKKMIIGGSSGSPFALSRHFFDSISLSLFPKDTGKRAAEFASWLHEREKDLMDEGIDVPSNIQCGELFMLCALVSSSKLSVTPYLPDEGVGEAEDTRTSKRKCDTGEQDDDHLSKRSRIAIPGEGEMISRREKGFPGMRLCLHRETISRAFAIQSFKHGLFDCASSSSGEVQNCSESSLDMNSSSLHCDATSDVGGIFVGESSWEKMSSYANHLIASCSHGVQKSSVHPNLLRTLCSAIQRSGDNGLSFKEIHNVLKMGDPLLLDIMVEALGAFGKALKVNAYDEFRVVDSFYFSKYFLMPVHNQADASLKDQPGRVDNKHLDPDENAETTAASDNLNIVNDAEHRVTILNLPGDMADTQTESLLHNSTEHSQHSVDPRETNNVEDSEHLLSGDILKRTPLLPWMNGDGTINTPVYEGLRCRVLGIVFQNPGILEDSIINQVQGLNPQSCRQLLETMTLDNHIIPRKMLQATPSPPPILRSLLGGCFKKSEFVTRVHYFANPMSITML